MLCDTFGNRFDVRRCRSAATANDVQPAVRGELAQRAPSSLVFRRTHRMRVGKPAFG